MAAARPLSACLFLAGSTTLASACGAEIEDRLGQQGEILPLPVERMAYLRVRLLDQDGHGGSSKLDSEARFVESRGLHRDYVRRRSDFPLLRPPEANPPSACWINEEPDDVFFGATPEDLNLRELSYLDIGEVELSLSEGQWPLSLELIPDLLPYVSGVTYHLSDEDAAIRATLPDENIPIEIQIGESPEEPFTLPARIQDLETSWEDEHLALNWTAPRSSYDDAFIIVSFYLDNTAEFASIHCRFSDRGHAKLSLNELQSFGLATDEELLFDVRRIKSEELSLETFPKVELLLESVREQRLTADNDAHMLP